MAFTGLLEVWSGLYTAKNPSHDGVHGVSFFGLGSQSVIREAHRGDVVGARELSGGVCQVAHVGRHEVPDAGLARERKPGRPVVLHHLERQLGKQASAAAQEDARRQTLAARKLADAERKALE